MAEFLLAGFLIVVGVSAAAATTYFYQGVFKQPAMLRFDGRTALGMLGHLLMSFIAGPFIMLQLGWRQEQGGSIAMSSALLSALVAFGWSFITGLFLMSFFVAVVG